MARFREILWFCLLPFCLAGIGCTRGGDSKSTFTITIPLLQKSKGKSQSGVNRTLTASQSVNRIMINVLGGGVSVPPYIWNAPNGSSGAAPSSVTMTVANGATCTIQVLLVISDSGGQFFEYGSSVVTPSGDSNVTVTTSTLGTLQQGAIAGRFLEAGDSIGRTGKLNLVMTPPGALPMVIDTEEIFGGWFGVFSPAGTGALPMSYVFEDGTILFTSGANISSPLLGVPSSKANMLISIPANVKNWAQPPTGPGESQQPEAMLFGFFGPGQSAATNTCIPASGGNINGLWQDSSYAQPIQWNGAVVPTGGAAYQAFVAQGGASAPGVTPCMFPPSPNIPSANLLFPQVAQFGNGGNAQALGFKGPFVAVSTNQGVNFVTAVQSGGNVILTWAYNPSAVTGISGVDVFFSNTQQPSSNNNFPWQTNNGDSVDCAGMNSGAYGFSPAANVPIGKGTNNSLTVVSGYSGSTFAGVICPYRMVGTSKSYFNTAVQTVPSSGAPLSQAQMVLSSTTFPVNSTCQSVTLTIEDFQGNPLTSTSPMMFSLPSGGPPYLYTSNSCTTPGGMITIPAGSSNATFFVTAPTSVGFNNVQIMPQGGGNAPNFSNWSAFNFAFVPLSPLPLNWIGASLQTTNLVENQCYPIDYQLWDASDNPTIAPVVETFSPITSGTGTIHFLPDCSDSPPNWVASPASIPTGSAVLQLYYQAGAGDAGPTDLSSNNSSVGNATASGTTLSNTPMFVSAGLNTPGGNLVANTCYQVNIQFFSSTGSIGPINGSNLSQPYTLNLSDTGTAAGGHFYLPPTTCSGSACCTGSSIAQATFSSGTFTNLYYLTAPTASSGKVVSVTVPSSAPSLTNSGNSILNF